MCLEMDYKGHTGILSCVHALVYSCVSRDELEGMILGSHISIVRVLVLRSLMTPQVHGCSLGKLARAAVRIFTCAKWR